MYEVPLLDVIWGPARVEDQLLAVVLLVGRHVGRVDGVLVGHFVRVGLAAVVHGNTIAGVQLVDLTEDLRVFRNVPRKAAAVAVNKDRAASARVTEEMADAVLQWRQEALLRRHISRVRDCQIVHTE